MKTFNVGLIIFDLDGTLIDSSEDIAWGAKKGFLYIGPVKNITKETKKETGLGGR